ncbi:MAG: HIT family protein [Lachnospiraceae bacterium]|nr:HIT family protein [Lachnospiraceae bacterium]
MKDNNCAYCAKNELLDAFAWPVCEMKTSFLYVFREQSKPGRLVLAYKDHVSEIVDLTDDERNAFMADVAAAARAIHKAYHPDKVNYGAYGDTGGHLHFHLCPKYKGGEEWGGTFTMNSGKTILTDAEYEAIAQKIRDNLEI